MAEDIELKKLFSQTTSLQLQLEEANMLISIKDEELALLRQQQTKLAELKSQLDTKYAELQSLQYQVELEQNRAEGGLVREKDMEAELVDSLGIFSKYAELTQQLTHTKIQLEDAQAEIELLKNRNRQLEIFVVRIGNLESSLAEALIQNNLLQKKIEENEAAADV